MSNMSFPIISPDIHSTLIQVSGCTKRLLLTFWSRVNLLRRGFIWWLELTIKRATTACRWNVTWLIKYYREMKCPKCGHLGILAVTCDKNNCEGTSVCCLLLKAWNYNTTLGRQLAVLSRKWCLLAEPDKDNYSVFVMVFHHFGCCCTWTMLVYIILAYWYGGKYHGFFFKVCLTTTKSINTDQVEPSC